MRSDTGRWNLIGSLFALAVLATSSPLGAETRIAAPTTASHPMDGLTADEIKTSTQILRAAGKLPDGTKIVSISLEESTKTEVRAWTPGTPFKRDNTQRSENLSLQVLLGGAPTNERA
jgi:primary-amine oxidase